MKRLVFVAVVLSVGACRGGREEQPASGDAEVVRQAGDEHAGHGSHAGHGMPAEGSQAPEQAGKIDVSPAAVSALGIRTMPARSATAAGTHRAPATVSYDPARLVRVSAQPGGQVRLLDVPRPGENVKAGQVLAQIYAPEVRAAFEELLLARELGDPWTQAARDRLRSGGILEADIDRALEAGKAPETYAVRAPVSGVVTTRPVSSGAWLSPGGVLATLAREGSVVIEVVTPADHPEPGTKVRLSDPASTETWRGEVRAVLSAGDVAGHAVRVEVDGPAPRVGRPLVAEWDQPGTAGVWVPRGSVVDTGERTVVFVAAGDGFVPRNVKLGARTADEIEIREGLAAGEEVVVAGTFLLDSETQMTTPGHAGHGG